MTSGTLKTLIDISYDVADTDSFESENEPLCEPGSSAGNDAALYIRDMVQELARMARHAEHDVMAYLLEMVKAEAESVLQQVHLTGETVNYTDEA